MNLTVILQEKCVKFKQIIPKNYPIIPELFLILFTINYSKNYSGIMYACLAFIFSYSPLQIAMVNSLYMTSHNSLIEYCKSVCKKLNTNKIVCLQKN